MQANEQISPMQTGKILWGALLMSQVMYTVALFISTKPVEGEIASETNPMYLPIFCSAALLCLGLGIFLPRFLLSSEKNKHHTSSLEQKVKAFMPAFILRLAMFEAIALCGFGLAFLSRDFKLYLPFVAVSAAAFLMNFPSEDKVKNAFSSI